MKHARTREIWLLVAAVCLAGAFLLSLCIGQYPIHPSEMVAVVTGAQVDAMTRKVFLTLRLARTLMALFAGVGLGIAGSVYQTVFHNPLASPDIIGVAPGANMGAAAAIVFFGGSTLTIVGGAFLGGLLAVGVVLLFVQATRQNTTVTYVLAGIVMSAIANAFIMILKTAADPENQLAAIEYWAMGSFANVILSKLVWVLPLILGSLLGLFLLRRQIALLSLSEEECRALGVQVGRIRALVLGISTLLIASIICITGLISFIGLIAPHVAKLMLRRNSLATAVLSGLVGGVILLLADALARGLFPSEIPVSILTTLIGVPILVFFMLRKGSPRH